MSTSLTRWRRENTGAVLLEALPGFFVHVFGIGHIVQGRVGMGLFIMLSYFAVQLVNGIVFGMLGLFWITWLLPWLFYMFAAPMNAADYEGEPGR